MVAVRIHINCLSLTPAAQGVIMCRDCVAVCCTSYPDRLIFAVVARREAVSHRRRAKTRLISQVAPCQVIPSMEMCNAQRDTRMGKL